MSSLLKFTKAELRSAGLFDTDADYDGLVASNVVSLMETFVAAGHSGGSARLTISAFERLVNHKPLTPLTGDDDEWDDRSAMSDYPLWQNKRCHSVFKDGHDRAWIVRDPAPVAAEHLGDGRCTYITFPYTVE
jgi:hypothetical protein